MCDSNSGDAPDDSIYDIEPFISVYLARYLHRLEQDDEVSARVCARYGPELFRQYVGDNICYFSICFDKYSGEEPELNPAMLQGYNVDIPITVNERARTFARRYIHGYNDWNEMLICTCQRVFDDDPRLEGFRNILPEQEEIVRQAELIFTLFFSDLLHLGYTEADLDGAIRSFGD